MSFTEDELQAFNTILEQRLQAHRRELERTFDQRIGEYRRESEQHLFVMQQDVLRTVTLKLSEFQARIENIVGEKVMAIQSRMSSAASSDGENATQQLEASLDRKLARQMQSIEELLNQHLASLDDASQDEAAMDTHPNGHQP